MGHMTINEPSTVNLHFGGVNKDVLFITASTALDTVGVE